MTINTDWPPGSLLRGVMSYDPGERKKLLTGLIWDAATVQYPVIASATTLSEAMLDTDTPGVRSYQRTILTIQEMRSGLTLTRRFQVLAYADRRSGQWKVWAFGEAENAVALTVLLFLAPR